MTEGHAIFLDLGDVSGVMRGGERRGEE